MPLTFPALPVTTITTARILMSRAMTSRPKLGLTLPTAPLHVTIPQIALVGQPPSVGIRAISKTRPTRVLRVQTPTTTLFSRFLHPLHLAANWPTPIRQPTRIPLPFNVTSRLAAVCSQDHSIAPLLPSAWSPAPKMLIVCTLNTRTRHSRPTHPSNPIRYTYKPVHCIPTATE